MPLHPAIVHFPIALLSLAAALRLWLVVAPRPWLEPAARLCLWTGSIAVAAAVLSGQAGVPGWIPEAAQAVLAQHQQLGFATLLWYGGLSLWELRWLRSTGSRTHRVLALAHLLGILVLYATAFFGGKLVYEFGVGISAGKG